MSRAAADPPAWSADAVWYQVLVTRFCNGEMANDPPGTLAWTDDWARLLPGEEPPLYRRLYYRGYGGDLQGLRSRFEYLASLGVNTLYLNPIFAAPSQHKYDTADHRHVDASLSLAADPAVLAAERADPTSWQWTAGDRYFLELVAEAHARGMRIVLDGVFNHVGREFWAWKDVVARGPGSPYAGWFDVMEWGPPLRYMGWDGSNGEMPRFRRSGDGFDPAVEAYLFAVVRRWMDPNQDGDPRDGIDGWRLDAAEQVPHGFWRRFRTVVKQTNPEGLILGEIWIDADPWLAGDEFDAVTNYRFNGPLIEFLRSGGGAVGATGCMDALVALLDRYPRPTSLAMANLLGSHDTERAVTMLADPAGRPRGADGSLPRRDMLEPTEDERRGQVLAALVQFTWVGAPLVYYGDELGLSGGDDPFCRAPMRWDLVNEAKVGSGLAEVYRYLGRLRNERIELRRGGCRVLLADDASNVIAYERFHGDQRVVVVINADTQPRVVRVQVGPLTLASASIVTLERGAVYAPAGLVTDGVLSLRLAGLSGFIGVGGVAAQVPAFEAETGH